LHAAGIVSAWFSDQTAREKYDMGIIIAWHMSYGPPWAHCLGGYQDRLLGGPLGLFGLCHTAPDDVRCKDYGGEALGYEAVHVM
jgi:hypothetical protein